MSLFTGSGVFDRALDAAGMECVLQCEIDRDCVRVLERHWPNVKRVRDVRRLRDCPPADLVCGGTPCQDLSVAGRRAGLAGKRSGLFHEFVRVADSQPAPWLLWENVAGAFSSNGGLDFAEVFYGITGFKPEVPQDGWRNAGVCVGPKRSAAWRVLDAQFVGGCPLHVDEFGIGPVPQRRRRVFIVAHTVERTYPAAVLFEPESLPGHFEACGEARPRVAAGLRSGAYGGSKAANASDYKNGQFTESDIASPVTTSADRSRAAPVVYDITPIDMRQASRGAKMTNNRREGSSGGAPGTGIGEAGDCCPTLANSHVPAIAHALSAKGGRFDANGEDFVLVNPHRTMEKDGTVSEGFKPDVIADALHGPTGNKEPLVFQTRIARNGRGQLKGIVDALTSCEGGSHADSKPHIAERRGVRRLLPVECLRLMGLPDDWLDLDPPLADSPKYRMIGNSIAYLVALWIAKRIASVEAAP